MTRRGYGFTYKIPSDETQLTFWGWTPCNVLEPVLDFHVFMFEETGIPCKKNSTWHAEVENRVLGFLKLEHTFAKVEQSLFTRYHHIRVLHAKYYFFCTVFRFLRT